MRMEMLRALVGELVLVEHPRDEADKGFGARTALVKATVLDAPVEFTKWPEDRRSPTVKGARLRLEEGLRVMVRDGFELLPAGHEFEAESRLIERRWREEDEAGVAARRVRYGEQDVIREVFARTGMAESEGFIGRGAAGFAMRGDDVVIDREAFAAWLLRNDPIEVAGSAIESFIGEVDRSEPWAGLRDLAADGRLDGFREAALQEMREGLAVSDSDIGIGKDAES